MGYVNVTDISQFISPFSFGYSAGIWAPTLSTYVISNVKTAAAESLKVMVPISLPGSNVGLQGAKLTSLDVWYKVGTAALSGFGLASLCKVTLAANGVAISAAAITSTLDADHDTAAERLIVDEHKMTCSITVPEFLDKDAAYWFAMDIQSAATTELTLYGARANYILRL